MNLRFPYGTEAISPSPVPDSTRPNSAQHDRLRWLVLAAAVAIFLFFVGRFYIPGKGFTALINFGDGHAGRYLAEIDPATTHITPESDGYDSQWYAQLAVEPDLTDPRLTPAIDNLPYRARRILFCWTAYALGLGEPRWVLQAFAVQNILAWLLLAWLLLRWLPPENWGNVARWLAVMFSFGLAFSIRGSLVDGPGLLLIAGGVALAEAGRPWLAALVLGLNGLGKETCILAGAALAKPERTTVGGWGQTALRGALVAAPLVLWTAYILHLFGAAGSDTGARNFAPPFVEFWHKAVFSFRDILSDPPVFAYSIGGVFTVVSLATQLLFFVLRPRWSDPWWRLGAAFCVLMLCLGESVWEGYPSAAARVLLPMLLAFNLTLPRGARWWPVFLLGNLTLLSTPNFVRLPVGIEPPVLEAPRELATNAATAETLRVELTGPWFHSEQSMQDSWRWTGGDVELVVRNPHPRPLVATLSFGLNSRGQRPVRVLQGERELWRGESTPRRQEVAIDTLALAPGETRIRLASDRPPEVSPDSPDRRALAFRVLDLRLRVRPAND